jgi:hypothetical protein
MVRTSPTSARGDGTESMRLLVGNTIDQFFVIVPELDDGCVVEI